MNDNIKWLVISKETEIVFDGFETQEEAEKKAKEMTEYHQKKYIVKERHIMAHENNQDYAQSTLPRFVIMVDHKYYCGENELVNDPYKLHSPWSKNSFHAQRIEYTKLVFDKDYKKTKMIDGRNNLVSHINKVVDYFACGETMPDVIKILKVDASKNWIEVL